MYSIIKTFLFFSILFLGLSCNSRVGLGTSYNKGDLFLKSGEEEKQGVGYFFEYKWQHMFDRNGIGVDYNLNYKGYTSGYREGADGIMQSVQFKYYYTLLQPRFNPVKLDIAAGIGLGNAIGHFYIFSRGEEAPFLANIGVDVYFFKNQSIYFSPKFGYIKDLRDTGLNLSGEVSVGVYFGGGKRY